MIHNPSTHDHVGDPTLAYRIFSAVTGRDLDFEELNSIGESIFNLQRAILLRQGWGGRDGDKLLAYCHEEPIEFLHFNRECRVPGRNGEVVSRKGKVIDRHKFDEMKSEYYQLRGWDVETGLQTKATLKALELEDVAVDLEERRLLR